MTSRDFPAEPTIIVNGQRLESGQAMAVRVVLEMFLMEMHEDEHLRADLGELGELYEAALKDVMRSMHSAMRP